MGSGDCEGRLRFQLTGQAKTVRSPRLVAMVKYADPLLRLVPFGVVIG